MDSLEKSFNLAAPGLHSQSWLELHRQALQFPGVPTSPGGTPRSAQSAGLAASSPWSDVAGSVGFAVILSPFTSWLHPPEQCGPGQILNLLEPKLSHLFDGGDMTAYLTGLMRGQNDTQSCTWEAPDSHWVLLSWL